MKLQNAVLMFMVTQTTSKKEKDDLERTFKAMDKNSDGQLSREELIEGYTAIFKDAERTAREVDKIMAAVDDEKTGYIDYSSKIML
jgi:calcium-dependent protein kinase